MKKYELAVAINGKLEENDKNAVLDKVKALIERFNGSITAVDDWGRKRYAYEIEKVREGWYVFIKFQAEPEAPAEIEQRMRIMDGIHRYLIVSDEKELTVKHVPKVLPKRMPQPKLLKQPKHQSPFPKSLKRLFESKDLFRNRFLGKGVI